MLSILRETWRERHGERERERVKCMAMTNQLSPKMHHGHTWIGAKNGHYQGKGKEGKRKETIEKKWKKV